VNSGWSLLWQVAVRTGERKAVERRNNCYWYGRDVIGLRQYARRSPGVAPSPRLRPRRRPLRRDSGRCGSAHIRRRPPSGQRRWPPLEAAASDTCRSGSGRRRSRSEVNFRPAERGGFHDEEALVRQQWLHSDWQRNIRLRQHDPVQFAQILAVLLEARNWRCLLSQISWDGKVPESSNNEPNRNPSFDKNRIVPSG